MRKLIVVISFLVLSFLTVSAQVNGKEIRDRDIEWDDFSGDVDRTSRFDAWTFWVTTYSYSAPRIDGDIVRVKLKVRLFLRNDSWVRPDKKSDRLLNHERGHFRIGRICANRIEDTINEMEFSRADYRREVDAAYWKVIEQCKEMNRQYDLDTNHYNNREQQAAWDKKLSELLED